MSFDRILVPLDGSALAERAVTIAAEIADPQRTQIQLLRAAEAHVRAGGDATAAQVAAVREAERYLGRAARRLERRGFARVSTSVWYGSPAPAIVEAARVGQASVIVMTTHGRTGLRRLVMGSVAEAVVRKSSVPVLVYRGDGAAIEPPDAEPGMAEPGVASEEATHAERPPPRSLAPAPASHRLLPGVACGLRSRRRHGARGRS